MGVQKYAKYSKVCKKYARFSKVCKSIEKGKCLQYKQKYTQKPMFAASKNNEKYIKDRYAMQPYEDIWKRKKRDTKVSNITAKVKQIFNMNMPYYE